MKKARILLLTTAAFCDWGRRSLQLAGLCSSVLTTSNISASPAIPAGAVPAGAGAVPVPVPVVAAAAAVVVAAVAASTSGFSLKPMQIKGVTAQDAQAGGSAPPHVFTIEVSNNAAATAKVKTTNSSGTDSTVNLSSVSGTSGLTRGEISAATAQSVTITTGVGQTVTLNDKTTGASVVNATGAAVVTVNTGGSGGGAGGGGGGGSSGGVSSVTIDLTGKVQASYSYSNSVPTRVTLSDTMLHSGDLTSSGSNSDTINASGTNAITGSINMGAGNDTLNVTDGTTTVSSINMGSGDDTLNVTDGTTTVYELKGEAGSDTINVTGGALKSGTISGIETINVDSSGALTNLWDGAVVVDVNDLVENKLTLQGSGAQTLILTDSDDGHIVTAIDGGSRTAATTLTVNDAVGSITTGSGDDTITLDSATSNTGSPNTGSAASIAGGSGTDKLVVKANASTDLNALTAVSGMETLEIDCTSIADILVLTALVAKLADRDLAPDQWTSITFSNVHDDFSETTIDLRDFSRLTRISVSGGGLGQLEIQRPGEENPTTFDVTGGSIVSTYTDLSWGLLP